KFPPRFPSPFPPFSHSPILPYIPFPPFASPSLPSTTKILVVDDEPDLEELIRMKFRRQIRRGEFDFYFAGNGVEALSQLEQDADIEIVLTDINMPQMDGLTLLERIADLERMVEAIVISA